MPVKVKEVCKTYGLDYSDFVQYLEEKKLNIFSSKLQTVINEDDVGNYVQMYKEYLYTKQKEKEVEKALAEEKINQQKEAERQKKIAKSNILISSGFNFEGYKIVKYSGYISGDDAIELPRSGTFNREKNGQNLTDALVKIRRVALEELKEAAYNLGCNAVIGVDFDYMTLEPESFNRLGGYTTYEPYIVCVTANGNAVIIEKEKD